MKNRALISIFIFTVFLSHAQTAIPMDTQALKARLHLTTGIVKQGQKSTHYTFITPNEDSPTVIVQRIKNGKLIDYDEITGVRIQKDTLMMGEVRYVYKNDHNEYLQPLDSPSPNNAPIVLTNEFLIYDEKGKTYHSLEELEQELEFHFQGFEKTLHRMLNSMQKHEVSSPEVNIQFTGTLRSMRGPCLPLPDGGRRWEHILYFDVNTSVLGNVAVNSVKIDYELKTLKQLTEGNTYLISLHVSEEKQQQLQQEDRPFWDIDKILTDEVLQIELE